MLQNNLILSVAITAVAVIASSASAGIELTTNGDFETGDTSGWTFFPSPSSTFMTTGDASSGSFAGVVSNTAIASNAFVRHADLGIGIVSPGDTVNISFDAKGNFAAGGIAIFEFLSLADGGGVSGVETLLAPPTFLTGNYQTFNFSVLAGANVDGGVAFQASAITGGAPGSTAEVFVDNVSVSVEGIPEPTSAALLGVGLVGMAVRRRR